MSTTNSPPGRPLRPRDQDSPTAGGRPDERRRDQATRERLVQRVLSEFREMPCLRLTPDQARRLFDLRADISTRVIDTLIVEGHIRVDPDGRYVATKMS